MNPLQTLILLIVVIFIFIGEHFMKFILFLAVCAALFWHNELHDFFATPSPATVAAKPSNADAMVQSTESIAPPAGADSLSVQVKPKLKDTEVVVVIGKSKPAPEAQKPPITPVPAASEPRKDMTKPAEDGWLTKWLLEHTPKK